MTKEAVTYRQENKVKRNDFLQLLIQLKENAKDLNNSKDNSIPWHKSKYDFGPINVFWLLLSFTLYNIVMKQCTSRNADSHSAAQEIQVLMCTKGSTG
jgi:hypothetical protein